MGELVKAAPKATVKIALLPEQRKLFDSMSPAWRAGAIKALGCCVAAAKHNVMSKYTVGEIVRDFLNDENKFGTSAAVQLSQFLGKSTTELYRCSMFSQMYSRAGVEELCDRGIHTGYHITYTHFEELISVDDSKLRQKLEVAVVEKGLTARDIRAKATSASRKKAGVVQGPGLKLPKTMMRGIQETRDAAASYLKHRPLWDEGIFDRLEKAGADEIDETFISALSEAKAAQQQLRDNAASMVARFEKAEKKADALFTSRSFMADDSGKKAAATKTAPKKAVKAKPASTPQPGRKKKKKKRAKSA